MDEDDEMPCVEDFQEIDVKLEAGHDENRADDGTAEYLDLDLDVDNLDQSPDYFAAVKSSPKTPRRGRRKKTEVKIPAQPSLLKSNYASELKLGPKYRPIRPKPYQPTLSGRKMFGVSSPVNVSALNTSNRIIVATPLPAKDKSRDGQLVNPQKARSLNGGAQAKTGELSAKSLEVQTKKDVPKAGRTQKKTSLELFFESMAQTVINLPMHVQAEIKMEICKIVTNAEIKYCGQARNPA